jgi:hypothetical protein
MKSLLSSMVMVLALGGFLGGFLPNPTPANAGWNWFGPPMKGGPIEKPKPYHYHPTPSATDGSRGFDAMLEAEIGATEEDAKLGRMNSMTTEGAGSRRQSRGWSGVAAGSACLSAYCIRSRNALIGACDSATTPP